MKRNFEKYCKDYENIEKYDKALADNFVGWHCHHRREAEFSRKELIALGMYYNRPAEELVFLTRAEHTRLHKKGNSYMLGKHHTTETKNKIAEMHKGMHASEETKKKMAESRKGKRHSEECKKKIGETKKGNTYVRGRHWYNNGKENKYCYECPDGFTPGMLRK